MPSFNELSIWAETTLGLSLAAQQRVLTSIAIVLLAWLVRRLVLRAAYRRHDDVRIRYQWRKRTTYAVVVVAALAVGRVWFAGLHSLATYLGLLSAGLAIALKDLVADLAGWMFILWRKPFEVGDRIQIGEQAGDVIDIRIFQFTLIEIGGWVAADQSTGRVIHIPNWKIFAEPQANYTKGFQFIWNEIPVLVTFECDWRDAKRILAEIADRHAEHLTAEAERRLREASSRFMIFYSTLTPRVWTRRRGLRRAADDPLPVRPAPAAGHRRGDLGGDPGRLRRPRRHRLRLPHSALLRQPWRGQTRHRRPDRVGKPQRHGDTEEHRDPPPPRTNRAGLVYKPGPVRQWREGALCLSVISVPLWFIRIDSRSREDSMEYRRLGDSDLEVSAIGFGAWAIGGWMWGGTDEQAAVDAIRHAVDLGMTTIDTAAAYGYGLSEQLVGRALRGLPRDRVQVLTKFGLRWDDPRGEYFFTWREPDGSPVDIRRNARRDSVIEECERSLDRLGIERIDLFQCHWRDHTTPVDETMEALDRLIAQGKVRAAGVSNFTVEELSECRRTLPIASNQPPYSMVNRGIEAEMVPWCHDQPVGLIVYSPLQKGLLTGKMRPHQPFPPGDHRADDRFFRPANVAAVNTMLERIRPIAEAHGATLAQLAIAWTIRRPGITCALVGARDPDQAEENARAAEIRLSEGEEAAIDAALEDLDLDLESHHE